MGLTLILEQPYQNFIFPKISLSSVDPRPWRDAARAQTSVKCCQLFFVRSKAFGSWALDFSCVKTHILSHFQPHIIQDIPQNPLKHLRQIFLSNSSVPNSFRILKNSLKLQVLIPIFIKGISKVEVCGFQPLGPFTHGAQPFFLYKLHVFKLIYLWVFLL